MYISRQSFAFASILIAAASNSERTDARSSALRLDIVWLNIIGTLPLWRRSRAVATSIVFAAGSLVTFSASASISRQCLVQAATWRSRGQTLHFVWVFPL